MILGYWRNATQREKNSRARRNIQIQLEPAQANRTDMMVTANDDYHHHYDGIVDVMMVR
jgi:hypothetical protein